MGRIALHNMASCRPAPSRLLALRLLQSQNTKLDVALVGVASCHLELPLRVCRVDVLFLPEVHLFPAACDLTQNAGSGVHPGCEYTLNGKLPTGRLVSHV